jgi:transport and Golgi organization protein 2|tara:strand:- start:398 stop:1114 length:717 start_codon:yes stop_codon:yes gene_type:complete
MCTVTFYPNNNEYILTSSRDEVKHRPTLAPKKYTIINQEITFPKDETAGGTWIATNNKTKTVCLLNGAFEKHQRKESYTRSRGLVLLESFSYSSIEDFINDINLNGVEPFTLLLFDTKNTLEITELRWDETKKHVSKIDAAQPHIWSSSTLYDKTTREQRKKWFQLLLEKNEHLNKDLLLKFHLSKHDKDAFNDIVMKRANGLQTVSVSQIVMNNSKVANFDYHDLIDNKKYQLNNNE